MTTRYAIARTDGSPIEPIPEDRAKAMIESVHAADSYEDAETLPGHAIDVHEYYEDGTPEDYPDGDPYAPAVMVLPEGWSWGIDGAPHSDTD